jgi:hypothetical protein
VSRTGRKAHLLLAINHVVPSQIHTMARLRQGTSNLLPPSIQRDESRTILLESLVFQVALDLHVSCHELQKAGWVFRQAADGQIASEKIDMSTEVERSRNRPVDEHQALHIQLQCLEQQAHGSCDSTAKAVSDQHVRPIRLDGTHLTNVMQSQLLQETSLRDQGAWRERGIFLVKKRKHVP